MPHAERVGDRIVMTTQWNDKELVKLIPGRSWDADSRQWTVPLSWAACLQLRGIFGDQLTIGDALRDWAFSERSDRVTPAIDKRLMTEPVDAAVDLTDERDRRLFPFQRVGAEWLNIAGDALLGDDMGTGKTVQLLTALRWRLELGQPALPALIICPNGVKTSWRQHIEQWFPEAKAVVIEGSAAQKRKLFTGPAKLNDNAIVIINFEAVRLHTRLAHYGSVALARCIQCDKKHGNPDLPVSRCEVHPKELNDIPFATVIVDEAHRIKDPRSKQTRAVWYAGHQPSVQRRWAATGTPVANAPDDLWPIMHFVDPVEYPSKGAFVDRYCLMSWNNNGGLDVVGVNPQTAKEFYSILDPRFRRMPKALVLSQLPPKIRSQRFVEMTPKQAKAYREISEGLITRLDDGSLLVAPNDLVAQTRLLQLSSSYCTVEHTGEYDEHGRERLKVTMLDHPASPKLDELMSIHEDISNDEQYVVSAEHRQLIELAMRRYDKAGIKYSRIVGGLSQEEREWQLDQFQRGNHRVLLMTLKAGGTGLTMTAASTMVCLQRSWSLIDNKQGEDRVHRIGSEIHDTVNIIDVITRDTIEETVQIPRLLVKFERLEEIQRDRATLLAHGRSIADLDNEESQLMLTNVGWQR
jgi:SNF2 family DNA or RNA helicase